MSDKLTAKQILWLAEKEARMADQYYRKALKRIKEYEGWMKKFNDEYPLEASSWSDERNKTQKTIDKIKELQDAKG
jgi:hypothetical protein